MEPAAVTPGMRAFCAWLARRAARHVRRLRICVNLEGLQRCDEFLSLLAAGTTACSAAGGLQELRLRIHNHPSSVPLSWVAALTSLRFLEIEPDLSSAMDICGSLDHLTNLQKLNLGEAAADASLQPWCSLCSCATRWSLPFKPASR